MHKPPQKLFRLMLLRSSENLCRFAFLHDYASRHKYDLAGNISCKGHLMGHDDHSQSLRGN